jgi:hypothetical protein
MTENQKVQQIRLVDLIEAGMPPGEAEKALAANAAAECELDAKFDEIASLIAVQRGYDGDLTKLVEEEREMVTNEACEAIRLWKEGPEMASSPPELATPLAVLLHQYCEIGEWILDIRDEADQRLGQMDGLVCW